MKGLDTSVLLALLEGDRRTLNLLARLRGVELATTEVNLLELSYLAARGPPKVRVARREALDRLRRKITVLPIDGRAVEQAGRRLGKGSEKTPPHVLAMLGALEANGSTSSSRTRQQSTRASGGSRSHTSPVIILSNGHTVYNAPYGHFTGYTMMRPLTESVGKALRSDFWVRTRPGGQSTSRTLALVK